MIELSGPESPKKDRSREQSPLFIQPELESNIFSLFHRQKNVFLAKIFLNSNFQISFSITSRSGERFCEVFAEIGRHLCLPSRDEGQGYMVQEKVTISGSTYMIAQEPTAKKLRYSAQKIFILWIPGNLMIYV